MCTMCLTLLYPCTVKIVILLIQAFSARLLLNVVIFGTTMYLNHAKQVEGVE